MYNVVLIWTDSAGSLGDSRRGPWIDIQKRHAHTCRILPVALSHHNHYLKRINATRGKLRRSSSATSSATDIKINMLDHVYRDDASKPASQLTQPLSFLPYELGSSIDHVVAQSNPFYAVHEVFRLLAASEHQFLNLVEQKMQIVIESGLENDRRSNIAEVFAMKRLMKLSRSS